jgi:hypothetical protein
MFSRDKDSLSLILIGIRVCSISGTKNFIHPKFFYAEKTNVRADFVMQFRREKREIAQQRY